MVLVMDSDGSLTPSRSQSGFAQNYNDGVGQGSASDGLAILGETEAAPKPDALRFAALAQPAPLPRADVLLGIEATALRYAGHPGLRRAGLSVTDWLALYRANIEVESAYRQDAVNRHPILTPNRRPKLTPSGTTEAGPMRCSHHTAQPRRASVFLVILVS